MDTRHTFTDAYIGKEMNIHAGLKKTNLEPIVEIQDNVPFVTVSLDTKLGYTLTHAVSSVRVTYPILTEDEQWETQTVRTSILGMKKMYHNAKKSCQQTSNRGQAAAINTDDAEPEKTEGLEPSEEPVVSSPSQSVASPQNDDPLQFEKDELDEFGDFDDFEDFE